MSIIYKDPLEGFEGRIQTKGYWGVQSSFGRSLSYTGAKAWRAAKKNGSVVGLRQYGPKDGKDQDGDDSPLQVAVGPAFWRTLRADRHRVEAYTDNAGNALSNRLQVAPNPFRTGTGMVWADPTQPLAAKTAWKLDANRSFWLRAALPDILENQKYQIFAFRFGNYDPFAFRFEFRLFGKGQRNVWIHRLLPAWTDSLQTQLEGLLALQAEEQTTAREAQIEALQKQIYAQSDDLTSEIGIGQIGEIDYGEYVIIPESRAGLVAPGALLIHGPKGEVRWPLVWQESELTKAGEARLNGFPAHHVYGANPFSLRCNGGILMWQLDTPTWEKNPKLALPGTFGGATEFFGHWDTANPGASIEFALSNTDEADYYKPEIRWTSNGDYPAFLYDAVGWEDAGPRNGSEAVVFDTDAHKLFNGSARFEDIVVMCDGPLSPTKVNATLLVADGEMTTLEAGFDLPIMHDRLCDVSFEGQLVVGNALIVRSSGDDWERSTRNAALVTVIGPESKIKLEIVCMWRLAEECKILEEMVLDGLPLDKALRRVLRYIGCKESEMSGLSENGGPALDAAEMGQEPCEKVSAGTRAAAVLRRLMEKYAPDDDLSPRTGVWTRFAKSTNVVARFCANPLPNQTPPEFPILRQFNVVRDFSDFHNAFRLHGGKDRAGHEVVVDYKIQQSALNPRDRSFIGRWKWADPFTDESCRSKGTATRAAKNLAKVEGKPGRFFDFGTNTILNLWPGARVAVEDEGSSDAICELASLGDPSIVEGHSSMRVLAQEVLGG